MHAHDIYGKSPVLIGSLNVADVFTWTTFLSSMNEEDREENANSKQIFSHLTFRPEKVISLFVQLVKNSHQ